MDARLTQRRGLNLPHLILALGLLTVLLLVMFRPTGAVADLPTRANVYEAWNSEQSVEVKVEKLSKVTRDYDVIPTNKKNSVSSKFTGVPLVDFLREISAELDGVAFVRVRLNTTNDSRLALVPLGEAGAERPPLMLASGKVGSRSLGTPALVPGQPGSDPISQDNIIGFAKTKPYIEIIPSKPGAKILRIKINKQKRKDGQYNLSANIMNGSGAPAKYQWFQTDAKGSQALLGSGKSVTTTATGTKDVVVSVVVTETGTQSTGMQYMSFIPKATNSGSTTSPGGSGGGSGSGGGGGSGTGSGGGSGSGLGSPGAITTTPAPYRPAQPSKPAQPPKQSPDFTPSQPAEPEVTITPQMDTTAITNVAQNFSGVGGLRAVSGVLLSTPTIAASGSGGSPISALPAPVADELNSIFQPVQSSDEVWAYLLAIIFAFSVSGAVREWVKP